MNLGQAEPALADLELIYAVKKDFFIEQAIARALMMRGDNAQALGYAVNGALSPGKPEFKWKLFMLIAQILELLGNSEQARTHALLALQARNAAEPSKESPDLQTLLTQLEVNTDNAPSLRTLLRELQPVWESLKPLPDTTWMGKIDKVHANGKSGNIRRDDGDTFFFGMRDFLSSKGQCQPGQRVRFNLQEVVRRDTANKEWHAVDIIALEA